jgi:hypothetical protein
VEEADTELVLVEARRKLVVETNVAPNPCCHSRQHVTIGASLIWLFERERDCIIIIVPVPWSHCPRR